MKKIFNVYHYIIMAFLMLFPIVMVGISAFAKDEINVQINYKYETNEVNSVDDLVEGNIYHFYIDDSDEVYSFVGDEYFNVYGDIINASLDTDEFTYEECVYDVEGSFSLSFDYLAIYLSNFDSLYGEIYVGWVYESFSNLNIDFVYHSHNFSDDDICLEILQKYFSPCENIPIESVTTSKQSLRTSVEEWANDFANLPINQWYGDLLDVIGIGLATGSILSVIYVYPLYAMWVIIIDLIFDVIVFIPKLFHNWFKKLGGDNL